MSSSRRPNVSGGRTLALLITFLTIVWLPEARGEPFSDRLRELAAGTPEAVASAATALAALGDARALPALQALYDDRLFVGPDGHLYFEQGRDAMFDAVTSAAANVDRGTLKKIETSNVIRRAVSPALAQLRLVAPDPAVRRQAAEDLARGGDSNGAEALRKALAAESDRGVRGVLEIALAKIDLQSDSAERQMAALAIVKASNTLAVKGDIERLIRRDAQGAFLIKDARVRAAAEATLSALRGHEMLVNATGHLLYGLSLASVLLFAALGLAITFGVMGVINMAHGEMLTIGAYTTYVVQNLFRDHLPGLANYYVLFAIPAAFLVAGAVGILLERTIIRFLYGRPLETLLATWGISLLLIQTIRLLFGAANVAVANPSWLGGGTEILSGLVLPFNRIGVVLFVILTALFVWLLLQKTRLGLQVRAVTQNRGMASCVGISTSRVDMWTFGLGSAVAGLGGVALSQLGNVGPELGQGYIVDSFMVVVLGGVGRIAGTVGAALGLGMLQKFIEPLSGAVLGKIAVLVFVIMFIQRRPEGLFSPKGRVEA